MIIGCVKESKTHEYRVGVTPDNVHEYCAHGHTFLVESGAGLGSGYSDDDYCAAGASIIDAAMDVWKQADMIIKVKEPLPAEYPLMQKGQILFTYLHLAADKELTLAMMHSGCTGVAYETIEDADGLPCLKPMSEIAGRLSIQEGAKYLEKPFGGKGILLGGVPGVKSARVVILGAGIVGTNALKMAVGLGADVTIMDISMKRLTYLDDVYSNRIKTLYSTASAIRREIAGADLVIGAVLVPGDAAPKLVRREYLEDMRKGSVMVDVAIDQGGCFETSKTTYHNDPVYTVDGIVHYCVGNMPGAVPYTSTLALTNATLKYGMAIADYGLKTVCKDLPGLAKGINIHKGTCSLKKVADHFELPYHGFAL